MKRAAVVVMLFAAMLLMTCSTVVRAGENLATNPAFEGAAVPVGWDSTWAGVGKLSVARDTAVVPKPGTASLRLESVGGRAEGNVGARLNGSVAGKRLRISGALRREAQGDVMVSLFTQRSDNAFDGWKPVYVATKSAEWERFSETIEVPASAALASVQLHMAADGKAWLADLSVTVDDGSSVPGGGESAGGNSLRGDGSELIDNADLARGTDGFSTWTAAGKLQLSVEPGSPRALKVSAAETTDGNVTVSLPASVGGRTIVVKGKARRSGFEATNIVIAGLDGQFRALVWEVVAEVKSDQPTSFARAIAVPAGAQVYQLVLQVKGKGDAWASELSVQLGEGQASAAPAVAVTVLGEGPASPVRAAIAAAKLPEGGTPLLPADPTTRLDCVGASDTAAYRFERVPVSGQPFDFAVRVITLKKTDQIWRQQTQFFFDKPIRKGDVLLASFAMRGEGTTGRQPRAEIILGQFGDPWLNFAILGVSPRDTWDRYYIKAIAPADFDAGKARLTLNYGFDPQTVEIADVRVTNYGTSVDFNSLPMSRITYVGREADAAWRAAAQKRIEEHRKGDLAVVVRDASGKGVPNASVKVEQVKHAFPFGMAVSARTIVHNKSADGDRYRQMVKDLFPHATIDWDTVWNCWETWPDTWEQNRKTAIAAIDWLNANGIVVHGCHVIWGGEQWIPQDLLGLRNNPAEVRRRWEAHIRDKVGVLKGKVAEWNAVNEPVSQKFIWDVLGIDALAETFRLTHEIDPAAKLALNDYNDFANWDDVGRAEFMDRIRRVKSAGAPIHVVGLQGHFGSTVRSPDEIYAIVDEFAAFGLPIHVSELDVNVADEQFQADFLRDVHTILFSHPGVEKITQWGFWEPMHWLPSAALWRADWSIKPAGEAWKKLVYQDWMTRTSLTTDASGKATVRGFLGTYKITATVNGKTTERTIELPKSGVTVEIR